MFGMARYYFLSFACVLRSGIALIFRLSNEPLAEPTGRLTDSEKHSQTQNARKNDVRWFNSSDMIPLNSECNIFEHTRF